MLPRAAHCSYVRSRRGLLYHCRCVPRCSEPLRDERCPPHATPRAWLVSSTLTGHPTRRFNPCVLCRQVKELFTSNMTALGIPTITAPGESFHIDWINATDDRETLIEIATKSYLDWYMLTQVRVPGLQASGPRSVLVATALHASRQQKLTMSLDTVCRWTDSRCLPAVTASVQPTALWRAR